MAYSYGSPSTGGGAQNFRVGYEWSGWSTPTSASATVTGTFQFFVKNAQEVTNDRQTFDITFGESGAGTLTLGGLTSPYQVEITNTQTLDNQDRNIGPVRTVTYTYGSSEYGSSPGNFTGSITGLGSSAGVIGFYVGGAATHTWSLAIPARPGGPPSIVSTTAYAGVRSASIFWEPSNADPAITSYTVVRSDSVSIAVSGLSLSTTDTNLGNNDTKSYTITAFSPAGQGSSVTRSVVTPSLPSTPGSLTADTATFGQIGLSWTASSTTGDFGGSYVNTYTIARNGTSLGTTQSLSYTDTTVAAATAYTYTVTPSTDVGSGTAASVSATSKGGVVNIRTASTWVKVLPKVRNSANTQWIDAQARIYTGVGATEDAKWKYGI